MRISQPDYTRMLVAQYRELFEFTGAFRKYKTPADEHEISYIGTGDDYESIGAHAAAAPRMIGGLLYLVRCARPDCTFVVCRLGRWASKWSRQCEKVLHRLVSYLAFTIDYSLVMIGRKDSNSGVFLLGFTDADHAGEVATSHSTSGCCLFLADTAGEMKCLLSWRSKKQTVTAASTGEAEVVATHDASKAVLIPFVGTFDAFMPLQGFMFGDASVAERCIKAGWSKNMRYVRKHQRVSISMLHDIFNEEENHCQCYYRHVSSEKNTADTFTKALPAASFQKHASFLGIQSE